ncbi:MAG: ferredoxin [bacterium]|nr:ferredoxin [Mycoplasmatota bacterium]MDD6756961.1 ferredoxin [bacterium]MDY2908083.1 ferredoxin [Candidatus Faecimonas sp.]
MKVKVNRDSCIGCGACAAICDEVFEIDDEGLSVAKTEDVQEDKKQEVQDAADSCPTGAIEVEE